MVVRACSEDFKIKRKLDWHRHILSSPAMDQYDSIGIESTDLGNFVFETGGKLNHRSVNLIGFNYSRICSNESTTMGNNNLVNFPRLKFFLSSSNIKGVFRKGSVHQLH